jgi:hypothetical protein
LDRPHYGPPAEAYDSERIGIGKTKYATIDQITDWLIEADPGLDFDNERAVRKALQALEVQHGVDGFTVKSPSTIFQGVLAEGRRRNVKRHDMRI